MGSALATVIGRGIAANKPASPNEGYLYFSTDSGVLERYSGSAWQLVGVTGITVFQFSTTTTDGDPGAGKLRFNNGTPGSVTEVYVDDVPAVDSADMSDVWAGITGCFVLAHQADDETKYLVFKIDTASDETGYIKWGVTVLDSGTLPDDDALLEVHFFGGGGGGGGETAGSVLWFRSPLAHVINRTRFGNGGISYLAGQTVTTLFSGTTDVDGTTGGGGFTESVVSCNCFYDLSPANGNFRGYLAQYVTNTKNPYAANGIYGQALVRFPQDQDGVQVVGFSRGTPTGIAGGGSGTTAAFVGLVKREADTNWQVATCVEGDAWYFTDTGVAWGADDWLQVEVAYMDVGATRTLFVWINGTLVATVTANLPEATDTTFVPSWYIGTVWDDADVSTNDSVGFIASCCVLSQNGGEGTAYATAYS